LLIFSRGLSKDVNTSCNVAVWQDDEIAGVVEEGEFASFTGKL